MSERMLIWKENWLNEKGKNILKQEIRLWNSPSDQPKHISEIFSTATQH